jgi:hypothetical protein
MVIDTQLLWTKHRRALKVGGLALALLTAIFISLPTLKHRSMDEFADVASVSESADFHSTGATREAKLIAANFDKSPHAVSDVPSPGTPPAPSPDRKLIRTSTLDMVVKTPSQSSDQIIRLAENAGGFLVTSQVSGLDNGQSASLTVRVPAAHYETIRAQIRQLGLRVESERVESEDVTKQYVDQEARLHNLRAQEQQYLGILRQASTVKDTLAVSEQLNSVRGEIEQQQAEFETLSKQVETVAISVTLRAEADAQVFGLHCRPLYQLKSAARQGLDSLGDYANSMASFLFLLPTIALWTATILLGAAICWRLLRWAGRVLFKFPKPAPAA